MEYIERDVCAFNDSTNDKYIYYYEDPFHFGRDGGHYIQLELYYSDENPKYGPVYSIDIHMIKYRGVYGIFVDDDIPESYYDCTYFKIEDIFKSVFPEYNDALKIDLPIMLFEFDSRYSDLSVVCSSTFFKFEYHKEQ